MFDNILEKSFRLFTINFSKYFANLLSYKKVLSEILAKIAKAEDGKYQ